MPELFLSCPLSRCVLKKLTKPFAGVQKLYMIYLD